LVLEECCSPPFDMNSNSFLQYLFNDTGSSGHWRKSVIDFRY